MTYIYLDHPSDVAIRAEGTSAKKALEEGAGAMLNVIFEVKSIRETKEVSLSAEAPEMETLFIEVLNELLSVQDRDALALKRLKAVSIDKTPEGYVFKGIAYGERFRPDETEVKTEVKAATYSALSYRIEDERHIFEFVIDV